LGPFQFELEPLVFLDVLLLQKFQFPFKLIGRDIFRFQEGLPDYAHQGEQETQGDRRDQYQEHGLFLF